jgi:hypothetical protein
LTELARNTVKLAKDTQRCEKLALLCPDAGDPDRPALSKEWTLSGWIDLRECLAARGVGTLTLVRDSGDTFRQIGCVMPDRGFGWAFWAAFFQAVDLVVSVESGAAALAGTIGCKTLVIAGPSSPMTFAHLPSVSLIQTSQNIMPCAGCGFLASRGFRRGCEVSCQALGMISAFAVAGVVERVLASDTEKQDDAQRVLASRDGPAVERERCDAVAGR